MRTTLAANAIRSLVVALVVGAMLPATPPSTASETSSRVLWDEIQPDGAAIVGAADFDGDGADEMLVSSSPARDAGLHRNGGFYVAKGDGSILWAHPHHGGPARPHVIDDVDGNGLPDVVAQTWIPTPSTREVGTDSELMVLSGLTGEVIWRTQIPYIHDGRVIAEDLNGDGHLDLVAPSWERGDKDIELAAYFGPDFEKAWSARVPVGFITARTIAVEDVDSDGGLDVIFGRRSGATGGSIVVLDGATGDTKWSVDTGGVWGFQVIDGRVVAHVWKEIAFGFPRAELLGYEGRDGTLLWNLPVAPPIAKALSVAGDVDGDGTQEMIVATGTECEIACGPEGSVIDRADTTLHAVGSDGRPRWVARIERSVSSLDLVPRPGGGADVVYGTFAWRDGNNIEEVGRLSGLTGTHQWTREHESEISSNDGVQGVAYADFDGDGAPDVVYSTRGERVIALDPSDGSERFRYTYPGVWTAADAGDLDGDGRLDVVGGGYGLVRAVTENGGTRWAAPIVGVLGGVRIQDGSSSVLTVQRRSNGNAIASSFDAVTGELRWSTDAGVRAFQQGQKNQHAFGDVNGDGVEDAVVAGTSRLPATGSSGGVEIVAVGGSTGAILWREQLSLGTTAAISVSVVGPRVLAHTFNQVEGGGLHKLVLLDGASGEIEWEVAEPGLGNQSAAFALGDKLAFAFNPGWTSQTIGFYRYVSARDLSDGSEVWREDFEGVRRLVAVGDRIAAFDGDHDLHATVLGPSGVVAQAQSSLALSRPLAATLLPGIGIAIGGADGVDQKVFILDWQELARGEVRIVDELALPVAGSPTILGDTPGWRDMVAAETSSGRFLVGFPDWSVMILRGVNIESTKGAWAMRVDPQDP